MMRWTAVAALVVLGACVTQAVAAHHGDVPLAQRRPLEVLTEASVGPYAPGQPGFDAGFRAAIERDFLPVEPRWRQRWDGASDSIPNPFALASRVQGRRAVRIEIATEPEVSARVLSALPEAVPAAHAEGTIAVPMPRAILEDQPMPTHVAVHVRLPLAARRWWMTGHHRYSFTFESEWHADAPSRAGAVLATLVLESLLRESGALASEQQLALGPDIERDVEFRGHEGELPLATFLNGVASLDSDLPFVLLAVLAVSLAIVLRWVRLRQE